MTNEWSFLVQYKIQIWTQYGLKQNLWFGFSLASCLPLECNTQPGLTWPRGLLSPDSTRRINLSVLLTVLKKYNLSYCWFVFPPIHVCQLIFCHFHIVVSFAHVLLLATLVSLFYNKDIYVIDQYNLRKKMWSTRCAKIS